ncbi:MAG TPA: ice-binding family protein, partial [Candidatus Limnocylindria bacterium]|nr:ice-binding family protein [Candidatus Limnocylindria bacterium]
MAAEQPTMGTAANYAVMATSTITNTGATTIIGGLALDPGTAVTGAPVVVGSYDVDNAAAELAHDHLIVAYDEAFNATTTTVLTGSDLGTVGVLTPGVYTFDSSAQLTGNLTLDGGGATNPVFIFQMGSTLTTAPAASVTLQNGAGACAIFWQVGSSATIDAGTSFQGTIMAAESITMNAGATIGAGGLNYGGRALAM